MAGKVPIEVHDWSSDSGRTKVTFDFDVLQRATRLSLAFMAEHLGVDRSQMYRYRQGLSFEKAEELAVAFGFVPENLWLQWRDESDRRAAATEGAERLAQEARDQNRRAVLRRARAKWRANNPGYRPPDHLEYHRRHYRLNRERMLADQKERDRRRLADAKERERVNARRRELYRARSAS